MVHVNKVTLSENIKWLKLQQTRAQEFTAGFKGSFEGSKVLYRDVEWTIKDICLSELNTWLGASYLCGSSLTHIGNHFLTDELMSDELT